jgi:hypothetical protein
LSDDEERRLIETLKTQDGLEATRDYAMIALMLATGIRLASALELDLSQRLIDKQGWALLISTPKGKGWFYDIFRRGQGADPDFESWNSPSWENHHLDRKLIEAERDRLPERVFRQEFGGEFIEGAGQVFRNVRECATGSFKDPVPGERYYGGIDLAKVEDFTVVVLVNRNREVVFLDRFHRIDWSLQVQRIKASTGRYNRATVLVDSTGAGEPVFEALKKENIRCVAYPFTAKSNGRSRRSMSTSLRNSIPPRPGPKREKHVTGDPARTPRRLRSQDAGRNSACKATRWHTKRHCEAPRRASRLRIRKCRRQAS